MIVLSLSECRACSPKNTITNTTSMTARLSKICLLGVKGTDLKFIDVI